MLIADALKLEGTDCQEFVALAKVGRARSAYVAAAPGLCEPPRSLGDLTGRAAELAWIHRLVEQAADGANVAIVSGGAGLGKTTLMVRAAHRLRDRFPDGVLFVDALGMSRRPVASDELLNRLLRALGIRAQHIPDDTAEKAGLSPPARRAAGPGDRALKDGFLQITACDRTAVARRAPDPLILGAPRQPRDQYARALNRVCWTGLDEARGGSAANRSLRITR
ncbi:hypothetical protein HDA40_001823 [Hamadaea flava]|uniref:ATP-binding protein n=1 Tax=Hamadaea flava TaxID=1742688 RepID=A0ABV8LMV5_9ACTN|nr:ATP-binding protein [Hamadaea flava]MCP2323316.1 hypothetical protein [Hamadaea flava]